jgi:hypothetical protein
MMKEGGMPVSHDHSRAERHVDVLPPPGFITFLGTTVAGMKKPVGI